MLPLPISDERLLFFDALLGDVKWNVASIGSISSSDIIRDRERAFGFTDLGTDYTVEKKENC